MTYAERKEKEKYLIELIGKGRLLSLEIIAEKFCCHKRTVERMINQLKSEDYNIKYCRATHKYFIEN